MLNEINQNKDWIFSGIGVAAIAFTVKLFGKSLLKIIPKKTIEKEINQSSTDNIVNVQAASSVSVGSITVQNNKTPASLATPDLTIREVGYLMSGNSPPEYTLEIYNRGGTCYSLKIQNEESDYEHFIPELRRGQSHKFKIKSREHTNSILLILNGLNANGEEYRQVIPGWSKR